METKSTNTKHGMVLAVLGCAVVGAVGAYEIAREPVAYIASMSFGILCLFFLFPTLLILFIVAVIAAIQRKMKYAAPLFLSCILLPVFFIGSLKVMEAVGLARYEKSELNEMRPFGLEPNGTLIIVYNIGVSYEARESFSNRVIHPWKEGPGFTHETGVCESGSLQDIGERTVEKVLFCASATDEEKEKLRTGVRSSTIVYRFFENVSEAEIRDGLAQIESNKKL
ncbi:MAG TPA: hypothetical protein VK468_05745 [Pyrinomonadaceae bacterium]|nr:hypothetical protein [Pyrinomonadaceae bacterium]